MKVSLGSFRSWTHWLLLIFTLTYVVTGLGMMYFRVVESLTFGLLTKNLSFRVHSFLLIPFLIVLGAHIWFTRRR